MKQQGLFITFEGPDGSGKTTQIQLLQKYFQQKGLRCLLSREPGGTEIGEKIRTLLLDKAHTEMDFAAEALLYAAARAQHVAQVIGPALRRGEVVICDRFVDSSIAYQGYGRQLGEVVAQINRFATGELCPDVTFFMQLAPEKARERIKARKCDRLELELLAFHQRVFAGYQQLEQAEPQRIVAIDASGSIEEIHEIICERMEALLLCR